MNKLILITLLISGCCAVPTQNVVNTDSSAPRPISPRAKYSELSNFVTNYGKWYCVFSNPTEKEKTSKFCVDAIGEFGNAR